MDKKIDTTELSEEDILLFRNAIKKIQPIKQDKILLKKKVITPKRPLEDFLEKTEPSVYLSDHSMEKIVSPEQPLFFARAGLSPKQVKKLRQGKLHISAKLDLHGFDVESARTELIEFIEYAHKRNQRCLIIIHGKGHTNKPVLKNKINNWLRQFENVLAFCTAQPKHGGAGAVYILLKAYS